MTDSDAPAPAAKATKTPKAKVPRAKPSHPPTNEMVQAAIKGLKERGGSSLIAIKKYIAANYKVDVQKLAPFIKRAVISGVTSGALVQAKGKGASGSFKLPAAAKPVKKAAKAPKKPAAAKKTPKKAGAKKPAAKKAAKSPAKAKKPKAKPTKVKKAKSPAKKPKATKPKKSPAKKPASKKAAAKK